MRMGPSLAVGEAEHGGDWGVRVRGLPTYHRITGTTSLSSTCKGGVCFSDEVDTEDSDDEDSLKDQGSATLAQRLLWLKHIKQLNHNRQKFTHASSPQPHASHQSPTFREKTSDSLNRQNLNSCSSSSTSPEDDYCNSASSFKNVNMKGSKGIHLFCSKEPLSPSSPSTDPICENPRRSQRRHRSSSRRKIVDNVNFHSLQNPPSPRQPATPPSSPQRRFFGGSRPMASLAKPLVALAVPGMFLVCKYHQYRRQHQEAARRRAAERELHHLNRKIVSP